jgi:hypothetical protein
MPPAYAPVLIGLAMWIPAVGGDRCPFIARRDSRRISELAPPPYAISALVIPAAFAVIYA